MGAFFIGHSMGGKVCMQLALRQPSRVAGVIVVDMAPVKYEKVHNVFKTIDADGSGTLECDEVRDLVHKLRGNISEEDLLQTVKNMDIDGDGVVGFDDFATWWQKNATKHDILRDILMNERPSSYFKGILEAMMEAASSSMETRKDVDVSLRNKIPNVRLRKYVLSNLTRCTVNGTPKVKWKCAINYLLDDIEAIEDFPLEGTKAFTKRAMFIGGADSRYITEECHSEIGRLFPNAPICMVRGAHHFVYVDKPGRVAKLIYNCLK